MLTFYLYIALAIHNYYNFKLSPSLDETLAWQKQDWLRFILGEVEIFFILKYQ